MIRIVLLLAGKLWIKNKASNIMVMIMIFITCYIVSIVFNQITQLYSEYIYFKNTPIDRSLLFMGREYTSVVNDDYNKNDPDNRVPFYNVTDPAPMQEMFQYAKDSGIIKGVSQMMKFETDNEFVWVYDEITASCLKKGIRGDGKWLFEDGEYQDDCYPVVVYNGMYDTYAGNSIKYKIGDVIDLNICLSMQIQPKNNIIPQKHVNIKCIVVGTVEEFEPFPFFLGAVVSNFADSLGNTFNESMINTNPSIFFPYDSELFSDYDFANGTALFYFTDNASGENINEFYKKAKNMGYCCLGSEMSEATKSIADFQFRKYFFVFYMLVGLVLISIICISFLNVKKVTKIFSVYYLNGCSFKRSVAIYFTYFTSMYVISFLIFLAATKIQYLNLYYSGFEERTQYYTVDNRVALAVCLAGIIISAVSTAIPFALLKSKTPIQNLREN